MLERLHRVMHLYDRLMESFLGVLMVGLVCLVFTSIVLRTTIGYSLMWAEEIARYSFIWVVYIGASVALIKKQHLRVDFVTSRLPAKLRNGVEFGVDILLLLFLVLLLVQGLRLVDTTWEQPGYSLRWFKRGWATMGMPLAAFLMLLNLLRITAARFLGSPEEVQS